MTEIINLRRARKGKSRNEKEKKAEQNRLLFGRTKAEKQRDEKESARAEKHLDAHKRDTDDD